VIPVVNSVEPQILPTSGGNVTISGSDFGSYLILQIYVNNQLLAQVNVSISTRKRDTSTVVVPVPPIETNGYVTLVIINPTGGSASFSGMYVTSNCPVVGQYGVNGECESCPTGAICPGGPRVWPEAGYWSPNEDTLPEACPAPTSRCLGGEGSPCATGYNGTLCENCVAGYEKNKTDYCVACPTSGCPETGITAGGIAGLIIGLFIFFSILGIGFYLWRHPEIYSKKKDDEDKVELTEKKKALAAKAAEATAASSTSNSAGGTKTGVAFDFFKPQERLLQKELEPICLCRTQAFIEKNEELFELLDKSDDDEFLLAKICYEVTKKVSSEFTEKITILDIQGKPSKYYDGLEVQKIVEQITPEIAKTIIDAGSKGKQKTTITYQVADDQGPRPKMEDKYFIQLYANELIGKEGPPISIFGVYDGHGGPQTAEFIAKVLHINILRDSNFNSKPTEAIKQQFIATNDQYFHYSEREAISDNVGATGVFTMIREKKLYVAWAGDSEAAIYKKGEGKPLCVPLHKPYVPKEKQRIEEKGGTVEEKGGLMRLCGALAVSRSFGDGRFRQFMTAEPDIVTVDLKGDEQYLVVACDGLWDFMNAVAVGSFLDGYGGKSKEGLAKALVEHARNLGSTDNITCCVVLLQDS